MPTTRQQARELARLTRKLEAARSALQMILTWATFEYGALPRGHALTPGDVEALCRRVLEETK